MVRAMEIMIRRKGFQNPGVWQGWGPQISLRRFFLRNTGRGLPWCLSGEESDCLFRRHRSHPWSGRISHATEQLGSCATTIEPVFYS